MEIVIVILLLTVALALIGWKMHGCCGDSCSGCSCKNKTDPTKKSDDNPSNSPPQP